MICPKCKAQEHDGCRGGSHCPCQHRVTTILLPVTSTSISGAWGYDDIAAMGHDEDPADGRPVARPRKAATRRPKP